MRLKSSGQILFVVLFVKLSFPLFSQEDPKPAEGTVEPSTVQPDTIQKQSYEAMEITKAFSESNTLITRSGNEHFSEDVIASYNRNVDSLFSAIDQFLGDTVALSVKSVSIRKVEYMTQRGEFYTGELNRLLQSLSDRSKELSVNARLLEANRNRWLLTLENAGEEEILEDRLIRINRTTHRLDSVQSLLEEDLSKILVQQDRLTDKMDELERLQIGLREKRIQIENGLFSSEMPGLIESVTSLADTSMVEKHLKQIQTSFHSDFQILKTTFRRQLELIAVFFVFLLVFTIWFSTNYKLLILEKRFKLSEVQKVLIHSPVVTVFFIVGLLIRFTLPHLPHTFRSLNLVLMMIPMIILVVRIFGREYRNWMILLSILCGLSFFYELTFDPDNFLRVVLLFFSIWALALFLGMYFRKEAPEDFKRKPAYRALRTMLLVFSVLLIVSVYANLKGAFRLAEFFTIIPIQLMLLAVGIVIATLISSTMIYLILAGKHMQKVNVIAADFEFIYKKATLFVDLLLWSLFVVIMLNIFRIKNKVYEWVGGLFTDAIKIGATEITIGNILIFIFGIWFSIVITKILRHILEKDIFPRVKTAKGVPSTIILFMQIILVSAGFLLAAAAAGINLTNWSIVLGAFSVGIGFGLQNIFNNMVSGLILAVERPIKVGDVVQVGDLIGTVRSIGLRSSNVKSFDGAEVIVPNGNLISNEMINWTLSDSSRRLEIQVGVAYGTDTDRVLEILKEVALAHELVEKEPPPSAYFTGFGDSSLDFILRAWTDINYRLEVSSELNGAVNKALQKAGIEIPFPQRDLHVRSDDTKLKPKK